MAEPELKFANALSLYIHYPFCVHKCPYCDFASTELGADAKRDAIYIKALQAEFQRKLPLVQAPIVSVYVGGGTPSLCEPERMAELLAMLRPHLSLDAEISFEANPGTIDKDRLRAFKAAGFNRISIGVQSFNDLALKRLGRIHDRKAAYAALEAAMSIFDNVNVDIMHGLPKQTVAEAMDDLKVALSFKPQHLSWYELTIEEDTAFGQKPPVLPDEDTLEAIEEQGFALLSASGYEHYEVSGYNLGGKYRCRHNMNYWVYGDYLGLGVAAHQKITCLSAKGLAQLAQGLTKVTPQGLINSGSQTLASVAAQDLSSSLSSIPAVSSGMPSAVSSNIQPAMSFASALSDRVNAQAQAQAQADGAQLGTPCGQAKTSLEAEELSKGSSYGQAYSLPDLKLNWREQPEMMTAAVQALKDGQIKQLGLPQGHALGNAFGESLGNAFRALDDETEGVLSIYRRANSEDFTEYLNEQLQLSQAQASLQLASEQENLQLAACNAALMDEALAQHWPLPVPCKTSLRFTPEQVLRLTAGDKVDASDVPFEYMLNRMRLWDDYWALAEYYVHTGLKAEKSILYPLMLLSKLGLIEVNANTPMIALSTAAANKVKDIQESLALSGQSERAELTDKSKLTGESALKVEPAPKGKSDQNGEPELKSEPEHHGESELTEEFAPSAKTVQPKQIMDNLTAMDDDRVLAVIYNLPPQVPALRPSALGKRMLNEILEAFLPDAEQFQFDDQKLQTLLAQAKRAEQAE